jgi:hypothetical protein
VGTDPGEASDRRSFGEKGFLERKDQWLGIAEENCEIPLIVGSWISCVGFNPLVQEVRTNAHRGSAIGI